MPSPYERSLIDSILGTSMDVPVEPGVGLYLMPDDPIYEAVFEAAVRPAMQKNGLNQQGVERAFNSDSDLRAVARHVRAAEIIVADVSCPSDVMYVLGLAHGLGRCPILMSRWRIDLPFTLAASRCFTYESTLMGMNDLRESLTRAIRGMLAGSRADPEPPPLPLPPPDAPAGPPPS